MQRDDRGLTNYRWAFALVDRLAASGVRHAFAAPGSRSTPLVLAAARHPAISLRMHFDERGTGFMALGAARATGRPALWITTSGTAVANGMPAVVEANVDGVPMLLLTADRPPELRHTGANQTIDQVRFFGQQVRWFFDIPPPDGAVDPRFLAHVASTAIEQSTGPRPGPVHLNCMFREPLAPSDARMLADAEYVAAPENPSSVADRSAVSPDAIEELRDAVGNAHNGLIVAGRLSHADDAAAIGALAEALQWPLFADVASGLRTGNAAPSRIAHYDLILGAYASPATPPDVVVYFGDRSVSKRLAGYLETSGARTFLVRRDDRPLVISPGDRIIPGASGAVARALMEVTSSAQPAWLSVWRDADAAVDRFLSDRLKEDGLSEPIIARTVLANLPEKGAVVIGSSMPVRDADMFSRPDGPALRVFVNRGASGIDGTVATAIGIAEGLGEPVTVLLGDLATLHDLNSLAAIREASHPIRIVVVNNDGGGIFSMLPIRSIDDHFEPLFGTPHGLGFVDAAAMFGLRYAAPGSVEDLVDALASPMGRDVIEVRTERGANADLHRRILADLRYSLSGR